MLGPVHWVTPGPGATRLYTAAPLLLLSYSPDSQLSSTTLICSVIFWCELVLIIVTVMTVLEQEKSVATVQSNMSDRYITPEYLAHLPTSVSFKFLPINQKYNFLNKISFANWESRVLGDNYLSGAAAETLSGVSHCWSCQMTNIVCHPVTGLSLLCHESVMNNIATLQTHEWHTDAFIANWWSKIMWQKQDVVIDIAIVI